MLQYSEIKPRRIIVWNDEPHEVIDSWIKKKDRQKPTNQVKMRNLVSGNVIEYTFSQSDKVSEAELEKKDIVFIYEKNGEYWFHTDGDKSDRFTLGQDEVGNALDFVLPGNPITAQIYNEKITAVNMSNALKNHSNVLVFGVFDGIHDGHRYFLNHAKDLGESLTIVVTQDAVVQELKDTPPRHTLSNRIKNLGCEFSDARIVPGDTTINTWHIIETEKPDIIALGYDQTALQHALQGYITDHGLDIAVTMIDDHDGENLHSSLINSK
jgi:cytidyltransferase-like protein